MIAILNGRRLYDGEGGLDPRDRGFTLGDGVFETIAVQEGHARHLDRHLNRLYTSLATLRIALPPDTPDPAGSVHNAIAANRLDSGVVRLSISRGPGGRGIATEGAGPPTVLATASAALPPETPVPAIVSQRVRRNEHSPTSGLKTLSYLDNVLARQEAVERGAEEAVLLNTQNRVAEASIANLIAVFGNSAVTPPLREGCLPGIARALFLESGLIHTGPLPQDDVHQADAILLVNTLSVRSLCRLDDTRIGYGREPALAAQLRAQLRSG